MTIAKQSTHSNETLTKRALLTGATGFIGGHLVSWLENDGWKVHALSRRAPEKIAQGASTIWHHYDGNYQSVHDAIDHAKPYVVFHLASLFLNEHKPEQIDDLINANLRFGTHLLEAMNKCSVNKLVNTGTNWQHLNNAAYDPVNLYAATKQAFEAIIDYYCNAHSLSAITLKLFDTYGPGDTRKKLIPMIVEAIEADRALNMTEGLQKINLVHVQDVCEAYKSATLLLNESGKHTRYGVFVDQPLSIRQIVAALEGKQRKKLVAIWGARASESRQMQTPPRLLSLPNWKPNLRFPD
jgi:nucleoside-diphosphate-sugar epimerase